MELKIKLTPVKKEDIEYGLKGHIYKNLNGEMRRYPVYNDCKEELEFFFMHIMHEDDIICSTDYSLNFPVFSENFIDEAIEIINKAIGTKPNEITAVQSVKDFIEPILESVHSEYPKIMEVSESPTFDEYVPRVVVKEIDHKYIAWVNAETFEEAEKEWQTIPWSYARDIQGTVELTLEEIAEKFDISVNKLRIKK